jgi:hypothetical protein
MTRRSILTLAAAVAASAILALAATASATREVVEVGNLFLADNGGIFPSKLPRRESAPVTARLEGEIGTRDGSHPPAVRTIDLDVDKTIDLDAVGLPVCKPGQVTSRATDAAKRACPDAIVGSGTAEVEVAFPEQEPFSAIGPIVVFNGGVHRGTTLLILHAYVNVPAPTAIVTAAKITRIQKGPYGMHIEAQIPRIAGGAGSVTRFRLKVGRSFTYRDKKRSLLTASCPSGRYITQGKVGFADGTALGLTHVFPCTPED